jgi:hypothetical protein
MDIVRCIHQTFAKVLDNRLFQQQFHSVKWKTAEFCLPRFLLQKEHLKSQ